MAMASSLLILLLIAPAVYATNYTVGDSSGWASGVDYTTWTSGKTFVLGDILEFKYDSSHTLDIVNQTSYTNCIKTNPISSHSTGNDFIPLVTIGSWYFICPQSTHCVNGMKMTLTVTTPSNASPPPPGATTPTTSPSPPPPPSSSTTSPPPPAGSGAIGNLRNMNAGVMGISLVLAPLLVLMG